MNLPARPRIFSRGSYGESVRISAILRSETVGGALLLAATVIALVWANSPCADSYSNLRNFRIGPEALRTFLLTLTVADDLIAIAIIAVFYPGEMNFGFLALAVLPLLAFTWLVQSASVPGTCSSP